MSAIYLRSVAPQQNRFRAFTMAETRSLFGEPALFVSWGRLGARPRIRLEVFGHEDALERRRVQLLRLRLRHGYEVVGT